MSRSRIDTPCSSIQAACHNVRRRDIDMLLLAWCVTGVFLVAPLLRDVKPNNILLAADLSVRLADVGLSRFLPVSAGKCPTLTRYTMCCKEIRYTMCCVEFLGRQ